MSRVSVFGRALLVLALLAALAPAPAAVAEEASADFEIDFLSGEDNIVVVDPDGEVDLSLQASDPLGLTLGYDRNRAWSQRTDKFDVWTCGSSGNPANFISQLEDQVADYYDVHSGGDYSVEFRAKGIIGSSDLNFCQTHTEVNASADATGAIVFWDFSGGVALNWYCGEITQLCAGWESYPENYRIAFIGTSFLGTVAAHEIGHLVQWPHSFTGETIEGGQVWEYDVAADLMSGNLDTGGFSNPDPYETSAINRYAAGWIEPADVWIVAPGGNTVTLSPNRNGTEMAVVWDGSSYYTFAARAQEGFDPIPTGWAGVEVYKVTPCTDMGDCTPGARRVQPFPNTGFGPGNAPAVPPNVITAGGSRTVAGVSVSVSKSGSNYVVQFGSGADQGPVGSGPGGGTVSNGTFSDDDDSVFEADIEWLVAQGITKGCGDGLFCPDASVTRGAMAAFLHRALPGLDDSGSVPNFSDIAGSVFVNDIEWLAATGVTKGCSDTRFCPDAPVTRGAMAAFLVRALGLTVQNSVDFTDDNNSVFENDIEKLATAGITLGCNPPANTQFCPDAPVTRGAMAAFLRRALG